MLFPKKARDWRVRVLPPNLKQGSCELSAANVNEVAIISFSLRTVLANGRKKKSVSRRGGATKGGVSKCEQTQTNADKRKQTQRRKRRGENASKRGQTWTTASKRKQTLTPPFTAVFYTPLCNPKSSSKLRRKFATSFAETFANFTLEVAGAHTSRRSCDNTRLWEEGVFAEKGPLFHDKRGHGPPPPHPKFPVDTLGPSLPPLSWGRWGGLLKIPGGGFFQDKGGGWGQGKRVSTRNLGVGGGGGGGGGGETLLTVKKRPLFGENALKGGSQRLSRLLSLRRRF